MKHADSCASKDWLRTYERSFLFIGGPLDGQVLDVGGMPRRFTSRHRAGLAVSETEYVLEPIEVERRVVLHFYRHEGIRMAEAVLRLMAAYADSHKI